MPLKLTPAQERKIKHYPIEQAVFVPSTKAEQKKIKPATMKKRVAEVRKYLSQKFGGYTSIKGMGGYYSNDKKRIIKEKVVKVTSFATKGKFKKNKNAVLKKLSKLSKKWGQDSMGYEHEGDLYYIKGSMKKEKIKKSMRRRKR